jgi:ankyrin repeat protein
MGSPISPSDNCPSDKACDIVLRGGLSERVVQALRCLTEGSDFIENQNFAPMHKIVLNLMYQDLETEILENPNNVDIPDAGGRTALEWAAARGNDRAVTTLLSYGADPNSMDLKLNTPLTLAANQNHAVCVRLLLEAGADPDPELLNGIKFGTPLNCAARNASNPLLIKTLLDFNANIEASNVDGITPLLHVARSNSASHAMLLLEYGADINATSKAGRTPLTTAIEYNNHGVLQLLLDRWYEYTECPRLKGPHLLELVAQYADVTTMSILSSASHLRLKYDQRYVVEHASDLLHQRMDASEKLSLAFDDLLDVVKQQPQPHGGMESMMESGLLSPHSSAGESDGSDQVFENAQESLALASDNIACLALSLKKRATL